VIFKIFARNPFPSWRQGPRLVLVRESPATPEERAAAKAAQEQWERDHPEEVAARKKRIEKANRWTAEDQRRWNRTYGSGSSRAREAGRSAAESVDLVREAPKTNRTGSAERTALGG
jgi:hypothetical protein